LSKRKLVNALGERSVVAKYPEDGREMLTVLGARNSLYSAFLAFMLLKIATSRSSCFASPRDLSILEGHKSLRFCMHQFRTQGVSWGQAGMLAKPLSTYPPPVAPDNRLPPYSARRGVFVVAVSGSVHNWPCVDMGLRCAEGNADLKI
jgi:hypothetical protein